MPQQDHLPIRVVFDANLFVQAAMSGAGPFSACFDLVDQGLVGLSVTEAILMEVEKVLQRLGGRPKIWHTFHR
jgi:predicted nucleic acid-binding protein